MPYEKCSDVSREYWQELQQADPDEIQRRIGMAPDNGVWRLPFLNRELFVDPAQNRVWVSGAPDTEPNFRTCLTAVLYLLQVDPSALGSPVSPKELTGASTFIQAHGPHSLPTEALEQTFGANLPAFLEAGRRVVALQGCSLSVSGRPATITTVAGESGSGKTTLAGAVLGFVKLNAGQVLYRGQDIATMDRPRRLVYRREVQAVFQDPYAAFNPFYRARHIFDLVLKRFAIAASRQEARGRIEEALRKVGLRAEEVR